MKYCSSLELLKFIIYHQRVTLNLKIYIYKLLLLSRAILQLDISTGFSKMQYFNYEQHNLFIKHIFLTEVSIFSTKTNKLQVHR